MSKRLIKKLRLLFTFFALVIFYLLEEKPIVSSDDPIQIYASICHDNLESTMVEAIQEAKESIYLVMYSLNDEKIIQALNQKTQQGVEVTVFHDKSSPQKGFEKLSKVKRIPVESKGLMHQKILAVDKEKLWIGSANFTRESLKLHDNLCISLTSPELYQTIVSDQPNHNFLIGDQHFEFWTFPRDRKEGFERLTKLIDSAEKTIRVAMYTWTHPQLTEAIIRAQERGVSVEVILDYGQANGVGQKPLHSLINSGVPLWLSSGQKLLHHKFLWIDGKILVSGSANWTKSAFTRNQDCFFVIHDLSQPQIEKLDRMWLRTRCLSNKQHLRILGQGPIFIRDECFQPVYKAA